MGEENAKRDSVKGENIVYLVYVEGFDGKDTLAMAFVASDYSTKWNLVNATGFMKISEHICSSVEWARKDMRGEPHVHEYEREFPDGYTLVEVEPIRYFDINPTPETAADWKKRDHADKEKWSEIYAALAAKRQELMKDKVYRKYRIVDALTGKDKQGIYFILKVDAKDETERKCVRAALAAYAESQRAAGRADFADSIEKLIQRG